jgi:translation initiation factor 1
MATMKSNPASALVYSTEAGGRMCPDCGAPAAQYRCKQIKARAPATDGIVRVSHETKGRKGKGATTISGVPVSDDELRALAGRLKKRCGVGGSVKDGVIELQGDHRDVVVEVLRGEGYDPVLAGG